MRVHKNLKLLSIFLLLSSPLCALQISDSSYTNDFTFFNIPLKCSKTTTGTHCTADCKNKEDKNKKRSYTLKAVALYPKELSYDIKKFTEAPMEQALETQQRLDLLPEEKMLPGVSSTIYQCPNSSTVLFELRYAEDAYRLFQFKPDSFFYWTDYCNESSFKKNSQQLFAYICAMSAKDIMQKTFFPSVPITNLPKETPQSNETVTISPVTPQKTKEHRDLPKTNSLEIEEAGFLLSAPDDAWHVLGDAFYPADVPGNLIAMRRFETQKKDKEIKINFSSKDKQPFLEKLKTVHIQHPTRQTTCEDNSILYETVSDGIYQAYLLSENTITVFSAAYSLPALPEEPHSSRMQKEFCALDVNSKW